MRKLIIFLLCTVVVINGFAGDLAEPKIRAGSLILGSFNASSKVQRMSIAQDILKNINYLDSFIPNPTPDEMTWITTEKKEMKKSSDRMVNFMNSPEFQKFKLKEYLKAMKGSLQSVIGNINSKNISDEMYHWGYISYLMVDPNTINDAIMILKFNRKIPTYIGRFEDNGLLTPDAPGGYSSIYHAEGEGIMRYIIMPYLFGIKMSNS